MEGVSDSLYVTSRSSAARKNQKTRRCLGAVHPNDWQASRSDARFRDPFGLTRR
jgi:hypothetical protein